MKKIAAATTEPIKFERTTAGLRDALMAEMEDVREGIAGPAEAMAFAALAGRIIESLAADARVQDRLDKQRADEWERTRALSAPKDESDDDQVF